jgi:FixJ family two-component response regulator
MAATANTVIIVEDDASLRQALHRLLEAAGFIVLSFATSEDLLLNAEAQLATFFIIDVHLPGLSGFELERKLQRNPAQTQVIFITAYDDNNARANADAVASDYLAKPFEGQTLLRKLKWSLMQCPPH